MNPSDVHPLLPDVERYCINLETISFGVDNSNCDAIKSFVESSPKLRSVELVLEGGSMADISLVFPMFEGVPKVKHLRLYNFAGHSVIKNCIRGFVDLEELTVGDRSQYKSGPIWHLFIFDLLCKLRSLRCLTVENWVVALKVELPIQCLMPEELALVNCQLKYFK
ncbi:GL22864 [Drosophila persimilis]|uniref:GL22864 n=1 Tax=Drosophila persimilis TaxID=7234 RepID=B4GZU6_DROPE|nr:GL22864 [Drosophila persimilis]